MDRYPTPEERKKFAQDQIKFLKEKGITNNLRLTKIFKAAGPGQIQEAWKLAEQGDTQVKKDLLDCILTGVQGSQDFGWDRMEAVLVAGGFTPPKAANSNTFFRILDGAMEILVPDSYEFSDEELAEMHKNIETRNARMEAHPKECAQACP
jgi:hypothetical protein